jgi:hypothetical protein
MKTDMLVKRALARLLMLGSNVEIVVSEAVDILDLMDDIYKINPDAVLFSESIPFSQEESISQLLMIQPLHKLIIVSDESNSLTVFIKEKRPVTELNDLFNVINVPWNHSL